MNNSSMSRRALLQSAAIASATFCLDWKLDAAARASLTPVRFGLCADPHHDVMHDTEQRLSTFIGAMKPESTDFILQMGDFCRPYEKNRKFLDIWKEFKGPRYHMLGNHDTDGGFAPQKVMDFWEMPHPYYSFDQGGWHFIVLNGNEKNPKKAAKGYPRYITKAQQDWLEEDLQKTGAPTILFSHQSLEDDEGIENRAEIRDILEKANAGAGWKKVGVCLSGHHHIDFQREINGIPYVQINSMSYHWIGSPTHIRYSAEIDKKFPSIKSTVPYKDALYARVTLDPTTGMKIEGIRSEFVGPDPWELGMKEKKGTSTDRDRLVPKISDRQIPVSVPAQ